MRLVNKSHASLNKLVIENDDMSNTSGSYDIKKLYKLIAKQKLPIILATFLALFFSGMCFILWVSYLSATRYAAQIYIDYFPKQSSVINHIEGSQLLQLFSPRVVLSAISEEKCNEVGLSEEVIMLEKDSTQATRYVFTALGKTQEQASLRVKTYTDAAIEIYVASRQRDLETWKASTEADEEKIAEKFKALENAEQLMNKSYKITSLQEELERVTQLRLDSELNNGKLARQVQKQEEEARKLETNLGGLPTDLLEKASEVYDLQRQINAMNKQLNDLVKDGKGDTPQGTELKGKLADIQARYREVRDEAEGTTKLSPDVLLKLGNQFHQVQVAKDTLNQLKKQQEEAKFNLDAIEEKMATLLDLMPKYKDILAQREQFEQERAHCEEYKSNLSFLASAAPGELEQSEPVCKRSQPGLLNVKKAIICLIFSAIISAFIGLGIISFEADTGKILSVKELTFQPGLAVIGRVGGKNDTAERLYFRFKTAMARRKTVFIGAMPGARRDTELKKAFAVQCALCGQRLLLIEMVDAKTFEPPEDANIFAAVSYKNDRGWMPLADMSCLSSSEQLLLEADLKMLSSDFDIVMIIKRDDFTGEGVFAAQMMQLCDATMLLFGANATPRKYLRKYFQQGATEMPENGTPSLHRKPVMGVLTFQD